MNKNSLSSEFHKILIDRTKLYKKNNHSIICDKGGRTIRYIKLKFKKKLVTYRFRNDFVYCEKDTWVRPTYFSAANVASHVQS